MAEPYTPDLWYIETPFQEDGIFITASRDSALIARVYNKAHAPLIAAAPDLLMACKQVSAWMKSHDGNGKMFGNGFPIRWLGHAIEKAERK